VLTIEDVRTWFGRVAQDPYGEALGTIAGALHDAETGTPEWIVVSLDGDASEGVLVPAGGALPTGQRIRVVPVSDAVRAAPRVHVGDNLDVEAKRRAAAHYGLALDRDASSTGALRDADAMRSGAVAEPPPDAAPPAGSAEQRTAIVQALRAAHAMEQASLKLLAAMRWRMEDEELVHDVALHHKRTSDHAEQLRVRLDELDAPRLRPLDWGGKLVAYVQAQLGRAQSQPDPGDLKQAHAFELAEAKTYERLERLALDAGDERTAELARALRADEVAMAMTIERSRLWRGPTPDPVPEAPST